MTDSRRRVTRRTTVVAGLGAGALLLTSVVAWAAHDAATVHACADKKTGVLRLVTDGGQCTDKEFATSWASQGQPGPQGPEGPAGPPGATGATGATGPAGGVAGAHRVFALGLLNSTDRKGVEVMCPAGEVALGGGYNLGRTTESLSVAVWQSLPITDAGGLPVGWRMEAEEVVPTSADWRPVVSAICAPTG